MKVLPLNWLKWRGKSVPKECRGYFSHHLDVYEASHEQSSWPVAGIVVETRVKNCIEPFCNH